MFNWMFEKKSPKLHNVGLTTVWFDVDSFGKKLEGSTYQGLYLGADGTVCWNSLDEAKSETNKESKIGLFELVDGSYITREKVYKVTYETKEYWIPLKRSIL